MKKGTMNSKDSREGNTGQFGGKKGKREIKLKEFKVVQVWGGKRRVEAGFS